MASTDKKNVISSLIESGKAKGKLSTKDITDALEELDYDVEQVDKLYSRLEGQNISPNQKDRQQAAHRVVVAGLFLTFRLTQSHNQTDRRYANNGHGHYLREEGGAHVVFHHVLDAHGFHEQEDAEGHEHQGNDQILFLV